MREWVAPYPSECQDFLGYYLGIPTDTWDPPKSIPYFHWGCVTTHICKTKNFKLLPKRHTSDTTDIKKDSFVYKGLYNTLKKVVDKSKKKYHM